MPQHSCIPTITPTMRSLIILASLLVSSQARLLPFGDAPQQQQPMSGPGIQLPNKPSTEDSTPHGDIILSDIIGSHRQIQIFAGFTRDISSISARLDNPSENTTLLAPTNSAITSLPRKPWEDPADYDALGASAYEGKDGEDRAHRNMRRFAEAHVVTESPWKEGKKVKTLGGGEVWWESRGEKKVVMPGGVEVDGVVGRVGNGEVWVLNVVVNYAS
ncbi:hypothetical protein CLAFUW4_07904 [Fulvia fulva]|nr:hypothetical protein CLAFUR4_07909 [Fulvia fulva]WPV12983.1 hypothetical protein CLAFUW4_07904 [Fulvia fulva]WPV27866.1 hypothetical protein CLAFUW7_07905 [Fulvia fulva]